jgi:hypothetical protein
MDQDMVADPDPVVTEQQQVDLALDAFGLAAGHVARQADHPKRNRKTHAPVSVISCSGC